MRCYSHLLDDEKRTDWLGQSSVHSMCAIAQAIGRPNRRSRANSRN